MPGPPIATLSVGGWIRSVRSFLGVLSHGALVTLPAVAVEALWKEWDDALGATKDT
jgi:hypothetical protein